MAGGYILLYLRPEFASQVYLWCITGVTVRQSISGILLVFQRYITGISSSLTLLQQTTSDISSTTGILIIIYTLYYTFYMGPARASRYFEEANLTGRVFRHWSRQEKFDRKFSMIFAQEGRWQDISGWQVSRRCCSVLAALNLAALGLLRLHYQH